MKIAYIHNNTNRRTLAPSYYFEEVLKNTKITYDHYKVEDVPNIKKPYDLYLRIDHGDYKYDIPEDLHPAVFYVIDTHLKKPYKKIRKQAAHYDIVFCAQENSVEQLRKDAKVDVQWAPLGCDPKIHCKKNLPKKYDVGFVGRDAKRSDRHKHLDLIRENFPNNFIGLTPALKLADIYCASKIGFNSSVHNDVNMRMFEILSCGCFLLTNKIKNKGLEKMLDEGKHFISFKSDREMLSKIRYYLEHDAEREKIAQAGYETVTSSYTYYHSLQKMFDYMANKFGATYKLKT